MLMVVRIPEVDGLEATFEALVLGEVVKHNCDLLLLFRAHPQQP
jgi:hypothetical protein